MLIIFVLHFDYWVGWQALDHVIAEAKQHGVRLLLSLVNNLQAYGGKTQYVKWAWEEGIGLSASNDSFFFDPSIRGYFKNYIKVTSLPTSFFPENGLVPRKHLVVSINTCKHLV